VSEIFGSGIVSLHKGQWKAAYSLGLSWLDEMRYIFETWITVSVMYIVLTLSLSFLTSQLEKKAVTE
jgi:ABC-type amino acid transport system permease subunit